MTTLVIASALAESRGHWIRRLRTTAAVCEVTDREGLEQVMADRKPSVLVVDLALPGFCGVSGLADILRRSPATKIVALAETFSEGEAVCALKSGARGYCSRTIEPEQLERAVEAVQGGEIWAPRKLVPTLVAELVSLLDAREKKGVTPNFDARVDNLTERQRVVADLISRGASNKEVARRLRITERTVKAHLTEAFRSVGVSGRLQLALLLQGQPRLSS